MTKLFTTPLVKRFIRWVGRRFFFRLKKTGKLPALEPESGHSRRVENARFVLGLVFYPLIPPLQNSSEPVDLAWHLREEAWIWQALARTSKPEKADFLCAPDDPRAVPFESQVCASDAAYYREGVYFRAKSIWLVLDGTLDPELAEAAS